ncbi:MAG: hypothetical protein F6K22_32130, partial [Okeania sp. SIO2F4]|uniref:hypothetical protein n=1 Tax=Okeania sp. SIO2F4 TaxID=2607790 RepID=UPI00142AC4C7
MSVFRNIVVVGVIGAVISNAGEGSSAPPPMHSQSNTPENSILDPEEVKEQSVEVKETQGVKSDINYLEKVTQLRYQGSLLEKLKSNYSGTKVRVPSNKHSEVNINQQLPESKANQERISGLKELENIYKNTGSLLAELKSHRQGENISPSELQFKQSIILGYKDTEKFHPDSKNVAVLGKSDSSLLDLLESKSESSLVEIQINPPVETSFKQSITFLEQQQGKFHPDSKNVAVLGKSDSSLLDLLESKSESSLVEIQINPPVETSFKQSINLGDKDTKKFNPNSEYSGELGKYNSSLLDLLQSKLGNYEVETEINPPVETTFKQSIILEDKDTEKFHPDSKKLPELGKANSSLLDFLQSKSGNYEVETEINPLVETTFKQSIILEDKDTEKFHPDSKKLPELGKANSSLLDFLQS